MIVDKDPDGSFAVKTAFGAVIKCGFPTNAAAWRWVDGHDEEAGADEERRLRIGVAFQDR